MKKELIPKLMCPECSSSDFYLTVFEEGCNVDSSGGKDEFVENGVLSCISCGRAFHIENSILRMLPDALRLKREEFKFLNKYKTCMEMFVYDSFITFADRLNDSVNTSWNEKVGAQDELSRKKAFAVRTGSANHTLKIEEVVRKANMRETDEILELGTGDGKHARYLLEEMGFQKYNGIDISFEMLLKARQHLKGVKYVNLIQADVERLPFKKSSFDKIFIVSVLYNLTAPEKGIKEAERVLNRGGRFVLMEYNRECYDRFLRKVSARFDKMRVNNILCWMTEAGFLDVECEYCLYLPGIFSMPLEAYKFFNRILASIMKKFSIMLLALGYKR